MERIYAVEGSRVRLGRRDENLARCILFDISRWEELYGEGTVQLIHQRCGDEYPYPCVITTQNGMVEWEIGVVDVALVGVGRAELQYFVGEQLAKSVVYATETMQALDTTAPIPPDPPEAGWVAQVLAAGTQASVSAKEARESAEASRESEEHTAQMKQDAEAAADEARGSADDAHSAAGTAQSQARISAQSAQQARRYADSAAGSARQAEQAEEAAERSAAAAQDQAEHAKKNVEDALEEAMESGAFDGVGIDDIQQTYRSTEDAGSNEFTVELTDGRKRKFYVQNGRRGQSGVATPLSGFFTLAVDENGDLWAYAEEDERLDFEYNSETGDLYIVQDVRGV
jgi:hypothetical protein